MLKKFLLLTIAGAAISLQAAPRILSITAKSAEIDETSISKQREVITPAHDFNTRATNVTETPMRMTAAEIGIEIEPPALFEDFSKMVTGSIEKPDISKELTADDYEYMWANMSDEYTLEPLWGCDYVYPAGGVAYMDASEETGGASRLTTPRVNVEGNGGVAVLSFKVKAPKGMVCEFFTVESAETNNWGPEWDILAAVQCPEITDEWQTMEIVIQNGGPTTLFNFIAYYTPVFIDDIKISQYDLHVGIPVLNNHTNYTGESFDISWSAIDGADSYLVNVYDEQGVYLYEDENVQSNSWTVTGIKSGKTYYYTVRAVKGEYKSLETLPVEIYDLEAPSILDTIIIPEEQKLVVTWSEVPSAELYNYWLYADRVATADGEFVITNEIFEGLKESDGVTPTERSIENPDYMHYDEYFPQTQQGGWKVLMGVPCVGYIALDGWMYVNAGKDAGLISPELDLSKDGGKVKIDLSLCGELTNGWNWNDEWVEQGVTSQCAIALFNYDEELNDYTQVELVYVKEVNTDWKDFSVTLTKGSERSVIGIYSVRAEGYLYLDNLKITQNYKTDEKFRDPVYTQMRYINGSELEVVVPDRACGLDLWHKVCAGKTRTTSEDGGLTETLNVKESNYSELEFIGVVQSGIEELTFDGISVKVINNVLSIVNPSAEKVNVYNIGGTIVYSNNGEKEIEVLLPSEGVYIVQIGNKAVKVIR